jgi:2-polyprenyl-3-methyl-5-hydroxy-6-metoxy-1,4-benzoquinol methylase
MFYDDDLRFWESSWENVQDTMHKDVYYLIDKIKFEYLIPQLNPNKKLKIAEVGCGSARLSCFLASCGHDLTCLDYSENALKVAKKNFKLMGYTGQFVKGDVRNLPFEDNSYDVIMSTGLLEHFQNPEIIVQEMVKKLKPEGLFYSDIVPEKFSSFRCLEYLIYYLTKNFKKEYDHFYENKMDDIQIVDMLDEANLEDITVFAAGVLPPHIPYLTYISSIAKIEFEILSKIKPSLIKLDDTKFAKYFGFYYFCYGKKPANHPI